MVFVQAGWPALLHPNGQDPITSRQVFIKINCDQTASITSRGEKAGVPGDSSWPLSATEGDSEALGDISSLSSSKSVNIMQPSSRNYYGR